jgi:hypothetical protein
MIASEFMDNWKLRIFDLHWARLKIKVPASEFRHIHESLLCSKDKEGFHNDNQFSKKSKAFDTAFLVNVQYQKG